MDVKVSYLEMRERSQRSAPPPRDGLTIMQALRPSIPYYRFLYHEVGGPWKWFRRKTWTDAELAEVIHHPLNEVHVLYVDGSPAGFAELDRRNPQDVELVQFGLMPEYFGQGLGKYFLQRMIDYVWDTHPDRFWLHTCTRDHPLAIPNYEKAGFKFYKDEIKDLPEV
ncbi:MAG: GNAT family N-acetyltransferase [Planctomycetaceae bacterium]